MPRRTSEERTKRGGRKNPGRTIPGERGGQGSGNQEKKNTWGTRH